MITINPVYIHHGFFITLGHSSTTVLIYSERSEMQYYYRDYWVDDSIVECPYISIFATYDNIR